MCIISLVLTPTCHLRFNRLAWSPHGGDAGVIAGGMEGGELNIWNTKSLLDGRYANGPPSDIYFRASIDSLLLPHSSDALIFKNSQHSGSVRGLSFNPFQSNLMASAAGNGEASSFPKLDPTSLCPMLV